MLKIYKVSKGSAIDFAAEELKKYLRMMCVQENDIDIDYLPEAQDGFRLGLFSDIGIKEQAEDDRFDDILYADCDSRGGVIAGNNQRSVLLAVYEYLRHNGLRWLYPGPDGEYVPVKGIDPVSFLIRPACRYRGFANAAAASYQTNLELIDFLPKVGMNSFMIQFRVPIFYTDIYYSHKRNEKNRPSEKASNETILQWKRGTECETAKRGLLFHDVGHGFCVDSFGIDSCLSWNQTDESSIPEDSRNYLAMVRGKRGLADGIPANTNFCMSNPKARKKVADYVTAYAEQHKNVNALHVWLADGVNAHCECTECRKKSPSDWYVELLNTIDEEMTAKSIDTKIVFLAYMDTAWAPESTAIKNQERFIFMLAPFTRSYHDSLPKGEITVSVPPYEHNNTYRPKTLEEYLVLYRDWKRNFAGPSFAFEYHFCWAQYRDPAILGYCRLINEEIKLYKNLGINGVVECGDMRGFLPNGVRFYTMARSLFDTSLTAEDIIEDYFYHAYGGEHKVFQQFFTKLGEVMEHAYFAEKRSANVQVSKYYNPEVAAKMENELPEVLKYGRTLVKEYYNGDTRVRTVSIRLLEHYLELMEWLGKVIAKKAGGDDAGAKAIYEEFEDIFGKKECEIERYFNQCFFFNYLHYIVFSNENKMEFVL